ncbi:MAG: type II toxin-antitoxin system HicA family toxin [Oscillospiraceae bacterium]|nr:type II toxin-antitoxin system HicA family toxin [Oscillospiraceae bacterium]
MTFREMEKLLKKNGWYYHHANGSHYNYKHDVKDGIVVVPRHKGDIPIGTLKKILKQAGLK